MALLVLDKLMALSARDYLVFFSGSATALLVQLLTPKLAAAARNREILNQTLALRSRLIAALANDAVPQLERAMHAVEDCSRYFEPNTRLGVEIVRLLNIYDFARQDVTGWTEQRLGERRARIAKFLAELDTEHKSRPAKYYLSRRPFCSPRQVAA